MDFDEEYEYLKGFVDNNKAPHALLFYGNKLDYSFKLIFKFLQYLNCDADNKPCKNCLNCRNIDKLTHPDLKLVFPTITTVDNEKYLEKFKNLVLNEPLLGKNIWQKEIQSENKQLLISKETINDVINFMNLPPVISKYRVTIIWLAEFLNISSANSLLKILEEPITNSLFILITNDINAILPTIVSRTIKIPINISDIVETDKNVQNLDNEELFFDDFLNWMRYCFSLKFRMLIPFIETISKKNREEIKQFLINCSDVFTDILHLLIDNNYNIKNPTYDVPIRKMSKFLNAEQIKNILDILSEGYSKITNNANVKIIFFNMSVKINRIYKK